MSNAPQPQKFEDLTIFTTTSYGSDPVSRVREKLALKFLQNAIGLGAHCVVVDGGSNKKFYEYDTTQSSSEKDDKKMQLKRLEQYVTILKELGDSFWERKIEGGEATTGTFFKGKK